MKKHTIIQSILLALVLFTSIVHGQISKRIPLTENNELLGLGKQSTLSSKILNEERPIIIATPPDYDETNHSYPVLYLLDGLGNIKHTLATAEMLAESGIVPPMIIVAIESLDRSKDLTPTNAGENSFGSSGNSGIPQSGGAFKFLSFLEKELIPYVESNYRTHPYRILEGHSFGGLFGVYALMTKPKMFNAFIIQAPALWWDKEKMTEVGKTFFNENRDVDHTIYFGIGGGDGWGMQQELKRYVQVIEAANLPNLKYKHEIVGDEDHDESRVILNYHGLRFIFSDLKETISSSSNFTIKEFQKFEDKLKEKYGLSARRPPMQYVNLYAELVKNDHQSEAIAVLQRAIEAYPNYVGLISTLAKLYEKNKDFDKAITSYQNAIKVSIEYKLGYEDGFKKEIKRIKKLKR